MLPSCKHSVGDRGVPVVEGPKLGFFVREDRQGSKERVDVILVVETTDWVRGADTARVETDDVEAPGEAPTEERPEAVLHEFDTGSAGATGIHEDAADAVPRVGCAHPRQGELGGCSVGFVVVERDGRGRALDPGIVWATRLPVETGHRGTDVLGFMVRSGGGDRREEDEDQGHDDAHNGEIPQARRNCFGLHDDPLQVTYLPTLRVGTGRRAGAFRVSLGPPMRRRRLR